MKSRHTGSGVDYVYTIENMEGEPAITVTITDHGADGSEWFTEELQTYLRRHPATVRPEPEVDSG